MKDPYGAISNVERNGVMGDRNGTWCGAKETIRGTLQQNTWDAIGLNEKLQAIVAIRKETWNASIEVEYHYVLYNSIHDCVYIYNTFTKYFLLSLLRNIWNCAIRTIGKIHEIYIYKILLYIKYWLVILSWLICFALLIARLRVEMY